MRLQGQGQAPPNLSLALLSRRVVGRRVRRESDYEIEVKTWKALETRDGALALAVAAVDRHANQRAATLEIWVVLPPPGLDPHEGRKTRFS